MRGGFLSGGFDLLEPPDHERGQQLTLGRKLAVEAADAGTGQRGHGRHRCVEPLTREKAAGSAEDALVLGLGAELTPLAFRLDLSPRLFR